MKYHVLFLTAILGGACLGDDAKDQPHSPAAITAIREHDHAVEVAEAAFKQAKALADKRLVEKLKVAMTLATKAGDLDEANKINVRIKDSVEHGPQSNAESIDLLKAVDVERDTVSGKWTFAGGVLSASADTTARIRVPVKPDKPYELHVQYARSTVGNKVFGVYLPVGDSQVALYVTPQQMGLDVLDGKRWDENETTKPGSFGGDKNKHMITVAVWQGDKESRIIVLFDGKRQIDWSGNANRLSVSSAFNLPDPVSLGISSWQTPASIYGMAIRQSETMPKPPSVKK